MPASVQRSNFRCQLDGSTSPQAVAAMSAGKAAMGGVGRGSTFHTEFPARQRKRLQVGATNLSKGSSFAEGSLPSPGPAPLNTSTALDRISGANPIAMKVPADSPSHKQFSLRPKEPGEVVPLVLRTEARRLKALSPTNSSRSSDDNDVHQQSSAHASTSKKLQDPTKITETSGSHFGHKGNNAQEDMLVSAQRHIKTHTAKMVGTPEDKAKVALMHNRTKLYAVFMEKYGSMRAVFRAFDNDGNGMISAQRFHDMVEAAEVDLTPAETRALYQTADINGDNTMAFEEFVQMFSSSADTPESNVSSMSAYNPLKHAGVPALDPSSSLAIKYRTPLELSPRSKRRMRQLRKQVIDELHRKQGQALGVHGGKPELLLSYAFKSVDSDNDGILSYSEVEHALGQGFLQLEDSISATDMREMLHLMDRNSDKEISLREFVHYFAVGERDIPTNWIDNGRKKELAALHIKRTTELTPRDMVDPMYALRGSLSVEEEQHSPSAKTYTSPGCLPEQLCKRTAAAVKSCSLQGSPTSSSGVSVDQKNKFVLSSSPSSLQLELERRPSTSCGPDSPAVSTLSSVSPDRFWHRRQERTDWTRVGVRGNGTCVDTGLYQSPQERFITTSSEAYSPLYRAPPSHKTDDGSFAIMRSGKSSTTAEEEPRRLRREARYERTQIRLQEFEQDHAQADRLKDWKSRANIRKAAGERFYYLDRLQDREQKVAMREEHMPRRNGGASFLRMWAGSADSQFNSPHQPSS